MKKVVIVLGLVFAGFTLNAQEGISIKSAQVHQAYKTGEFTITVPEDITSEQVDKLKGYYTEYFSVTFDENKDVLSFIVNKDKEGAFRVVNRMLVGLNLKTFMVDGESMTFEQLYVKYYN